MAHYGCNPADAPASQFTSVATGNGTAASGALEGAQYTVYATSGATALTTRTATQMLANLAWAQASGPAYSYVLRVYNTNGGTLTLTGGTGVTITGTATLATNVWREYLVTVTSLTTPALTLQNIGAGNAT